MHLRCPLAVATLAGLSLIVGVASAQDIAPRLVLMSSVGYNDNVTNAPSFPRTTSPVRQGDGFVSLSPTASISYATALATHKLLYTFDGRFNFTRTDANTYGNKLAYQGSYELDAKTTFALNGSAKYGRLGSVAASDPASEALLDALPTGLFTYVDLAADEKVTRSLSAVLRAYQTLAVNERIPIESGDEFTDKSLTRVLAGRARPKLTAAHTLGVARDFSFDSLGGDLVVSYLETSDQARVLNSLTASWQHDYEHLGVLGVTTKLELGVVQTMRADTATGQFWQPAGTATATYDLDEQQVSLVFLHTPKVNSQNGTLNYVDSLTLRGSIPLGTNTDFKMSGSLGWQRSIQIDATGNVGDPQNSFLGDTQLSWAPTVRELSSLTFSLRYQRRVQLQMPDARPGFAAFDGSEANTVLFMVAVSYPSRDTYRAPFIAPSFRPEPTSNTDIVAPEEAIEGE